MYQSTSFKTEVEHITFAIQINSMLSLSIGSDSKGNIIFKSLPELRNLFVSYLEDDQIINIFKMLLENGTDIIGRILLITKEDNLIELTSFKNYETYIYNNPEIGSIKKKNLLFSQIIKEQKKGIKKSVNSKVTLVLIDDMWQFYPRFTSKNAINNFRQLLEYGYLFNIHFVVGSILPYRNLFVQLMRSDTLGGNKNIVSSIGAELIYSPDELIFFREVITEKQEIYYPIKPEKIVVQ